MSKTTLTIIVYVLGLIFGALFLLTCDILIQQVSGFLIVPINALTSLIGAPFVIYILIRKVR